MSALEPWWWFRFISSADYCRVLFVDRLRQPNNSFKFDLLNGICFCHFPVPYIHRNCWIMNHDYAIHFLNILISCRLVHDSLWVHTSPHKVYVCMRPDAGELALIENFRFLQNKNGENKQLAPFFIEKEWSFWIQKRMVLKTTEWSKQRFASTFLGSRDGYGPQDHKMST